MKRILFVLALISFFSGSYAQYQVGHRTITFQDPARSNRDIETEIYYPAATAGDNVAVASGQFPVVAYGHGFLMGVSSYENIWNALCPLGYIVALPTTEGGSPSHSDFGMDLAFLINKIKSEGTNPSSPFYQSIAATSAVMGHSMGGGSSFLACAGNAIPTVMVTYAAANTTPSSIHAAQSITIPSLVISGESDCVAPPATHQLPMYDSLAGNCKIYISIKDGGHCYFANYNFLCTTGEESCNPGGVPLSRAEQQATTMNFVKPYLDYFLKGNVSSWNSFVDSLTNSSKITFIKNCEINPGNISEETSQTKISIYPSPASDRLTISCSKHGNISAVFFDITGKYLFSKEVGVDKAEIDIGRLQQGIYMIKFFSGKEPVFTGRFTKL